MMEARTAKNRIERGAAGLRDLVTLTKPEVTLLVVAATAIGYYLASPSPAERGRFVGALIGTALVSGGTAALNMFMERELDARMRRTALRPLPAGRMRPATAFGVGLGLAAAGGGCLYAFVNGLSSAIALATLATYLLIYTPLKRRTGLCTFLGAFPGAAPPLIGWAAARGTLGAEAWALFAILFLWQFPHFLAIAWMYRQDYARAGMRMLPPADDDGVATFRRIVLFTAALVPASFLPSLLGVGGPVYLAGAAVLGGAFLASCVWAARNRTGWHARMLLHASVAYLPLLWGLLALDRRGS
jgi:protoheme IX farnesyltransferase